MDLSFTQFFGTLIFILAITHTFLTPGFYSLSEKYKKKSESSPIHTNRYRLISETFYLLSELELVFGFWIIPLVLGLFFHSGVRDVLSHLESYNYSYPLYMTVVVIIISTKPIISFAERLLELIARFGGNTAKSWWWTILTVGPILDVILKEPGAMTLSSIVLAKTCFPLIKNKKFRYATLALLFINISIGGFLFPLTSRSLFLIATQKGWELSYTLSQFGWKALLIIIINNTFYYSLFRSYFPKDSSSIKQELKKNKTREFPHWLTGLHLAFLIAILLTAEYPILFLGIFFIFLGVHKATAFYQGKREEYLQLKPAIFIGFFFASLLIHGEFQKWWIVDLLQNISFGKGIMLSAFLSSLVDNTIVLYFLSQIKTLSEIAIYAIVVGSLAAGGLTIMANAPNLIGYTLLKPFFRGKLSLFALFYMAIPPTLIALVIFWLFQ